VNDMKFAPYHIFACCVLHNICLLQNDELELQDQLMLIREQVEAREERIIEYNNRNAAVIKRDNICANLNMRNINESKFKCSISNICIYIYISNYNIKYTCTYLCYIYCLFLDTT